MASGANRLLLPLRTQVSDVKDTTMVSQSLLTPPYGY